MIKAKNDDIKQILSFLKKDLPNALYMYIDLLKYGINNDDVDVWYEKKNAGLFCILLRYFNSINIYCKSAEFDKEETINIANKYNIHVINGNIEAIKALSIYCDLNCETNGIVFKLTKYVDYFKDIPIFEVNEDCYDEIAKLICRDDNFSTIYDEKEISNQLRNRKKDNFGRNFVIKDNNRIIAHIATYAEINKIAITSGLVVDSKYQNGIFGAALENYLIYTLIKEGFDVYTLVNKKIREKYLEINGNKKIGRYGRIVL